ncbi:hypothetical protein [Streptomyces sp. SM1]|uniref:hypothetical protein n=1 Tax=Streptomyces sp. SM1 TaxID=402229 RepID=UPI0011B0B774|nr:hypothetical protein [Streptomyces sp. SM1]
MVGNIRRGGPHCFTRPGTMPGCWEGCTALGGKTWSSDGGHHAIKGFAFQFDASLLQVLTNPGVAVEIEGAQDIGVRTFHIQVKHRSTSYSLSRIAPAVRQMMSQFATDSTLRFALYGHFPDRIPGETLRINREELETALGKFSDDYSNDIKDWFTKSFEVIFAPDFVSQFSSVLDHLKRTLRARSEAEALCWHAVIHGYLRDVILKRPLGERSITLRDLRDLVHQARTAVFEASYAQVCGHEKYLRLIREEYKSVTAHVPPRERLILVECDDQTHPLDLVDVAVCLQRRYFAGESPAPYVCFRGPIGLLSIKHALWQQRVHFHDGFDYGGAEFSVQSLVSPRLPGHGIKLVDPLVLAQLVGHVKMNEVHDFYLTEPTGNLFPDARVRHVIVQSPSDLREVFKSGGSGVKR